MTGPSGLTGRAPSFGSGDYRFDLQPGNTKNLYTRCTRNPFSWRSSLRKRDRTGHTGASIMQLVVVSRHNVWDMHYENMPIQIY